MSLGPKVEGQRSAFDLFYCSYVNPFFLQNQVNFTIKSYRPNLCFRNVKKAPAAARQ